MAVGEKRDPTTVPDHKATMANEPGNERQTGPQPVASPLDGRLARWPLFPYLLCYFAVVSLLAPNVLEVPPPMVLPLVGGILLGCSAVHLVLYFALRRQAAAAGLVAFGLVFAFFFKARLVQLLVGLPGSTWRLPLGPFSMSLCLFLAVGLCAAVVLSGCALAWYLSTRALRMVTLCLNLLLLGLSLTSSAAAARGWRSAPESPPALLFAPQDAEGIEPGQYPDIVHIVLDAYARDDVYRSITGGTPSPLSETLRELHFQVAEHSASNFPDTISSMFCLMNATYPRDMRISSYSRAFSESIVFRQLRHLGYRVKCDSWIGMGSATVDSFGCREFRRGFWSSTLWGPVHKLLHRLGWVSSRRMHRPYREEFDATVRRLSGFESEEGQPVYFLAHVIGAHPPFVFDSEGGHIEDIRFRTGADAAGIGFATTECSQDQGEYCRRKIGSALREFLARKRSRPCVIIVQSDHGPRYSEIPLGAFPGGSSSSSKDGFPPNADGTQQWTWRFANYLAVWASPTLSFTVPDITTPVNLYPLLFNQIFRTSFPLRADRFFTRDGDCTEEIRRALLPTSEH